jgi:hypothetical protein
MLSSETVADKTNGGAVCSRASGQSTVFYRRVQTGRKRFDTVSFVTASIQHDALLESRLSFGAERAVKHKAKPYIGQRVHQNIASVIKKLFK